MKYSVVVQWDPRDEIFVAYAPELPGCMTHGATREEAVKNCEEAMRAWVGNESKPPEPHIFSYPENWFCQPDMP